MRVLITSGATREPIDSVRFMTNFSSGATGAEIADYFSSRGSDVLLLRGEGAQKPLHTPSFEFSSFNNLSDQLQKTLSAEHWDVCIHAAAVSDYSVANVHPRKIDSHGELTLTLTPNPKLIDAIKQWSQNKKIKLVAFKLTDTEDEISRQNAIQKLFTRAHSNLVVHNDASDIRRGVRNFTVYTDQGAEKTRFSSRLELAQGLYEEIQTLPFL